MRVRTCLLLALGTGLLGLGLRAAIPVTPVDEPFRELVRYYDARDRSARPCPVERGPASNMPETCMP